MSEAIEVIDSSATCAMSHWTCWSALHTTRLLWWVGAFYSSPLHCNAGLLQTFDRIVIYAPCPRKNCTPYKWP